MLALALLLLQTILFITAPTQLAIDPCGCEDKPQVNTLAVVNGVKITKQELGSDVQNQITTLHNEVMRARDAELDLQINRYLVDSEAKRRGLTAQQFLKLEVIDKVSDPTQAEVEIFYKERKERMPGDFKNVKPKIISLIRAERETLAATKLALDLRAAANVKLLVQSVTPPANEVDLNRVFAIVGSRKFTSRDIENGLSPLIFSVKQQVYNLRKNDLDLRINDMLLEQEAKRLNLTPEAVLMRAIRPRLPIITDQQAKAFYDQNKGKIQGDFQKVKLQIIQLLMSKEQEKLSKAYAEELRQNAAVQIYLTPPEQPSTKRQ